MEAFTPEAHAEPQPKKESPEVAADGKPIGMGG
jgi:hypothetical protein